MKKIFVDSNYLVDYLRGKEYTKTFIDNVEDKELEAYISVVTAFELYTGAMLSDKKEGFEDVEKLLNWFHLVDITKEVMLYAAKIHVDLRKRGLMIEVEDILIAASSISMNMALITNNKKHFQNIKGLHLE